MNQKIRLIQMYFNISNKLTFTKIEILFIKDNLLEDIKTGNLLPCFLS